MAKNQPTDYDALLRDLKAESAPKEDRMLGLTAVEWGEKWNLDAGTALRKIKPGLKSGSWIENKGARLKEDGTARWYPVYRPKEGFNG